MKKKLLLLNLALAAIVALTAYEIRRGYVEAAQRQYRVLGHKPAAVRTPPPAPTAGVALVTPAQYADVAQKMLFTADRNPAVILDPVKPPPEKPVPPFPVSHGVILFGDLPPTIILSQRGKNDQKGYKVGDMVGPFRIASIDNTDVVFTWDGKEFTKPIAGLVDYSEPAASSSSERAASPRGTPGATATSGTYGNPLAEEDPAKKASLSPQELMRPGAPMGNNFFGCNSGDTSPAGTIFDGKVKKEAQNPFSPGGKSCYWEASH